MKRFPIGIQTFEEIVEGDFLYVDKTKQIVDLLTEGKYFFLSRPRRFGKSLTLSTIKSIFEGKKELFNGLWIMDKWDWEKTHPVIHISFSSIGYREMGLEKAIEKVLKEIALQHQVNLESQSVSQLFKELLQKVAAKGEKVILLIDEYDKPLIDYIGEEIEQAKINQQILKTFYSVVKDSDPLIKFFLITGISKFSKVSIFSDLNNLYDLTMDWRFADLVGYTQKELEYYFEPHFELALRRNKLKNTSELLKKVKHWYNGYSWDAETFVYNPFSILCFFQTGEFSNYWFETGTPTLLLKLIAKDKNYQLSNLRTSGSSFSSYDIENLHSLPILFQTGYLTVKGKDKHRYQLDYPNYEVRDSLYQYILSDLSFTQPGFTTNIIIELQDAFYDNDIPAVIDIIKGVFANIPYQIFIANLEAYYHSLLYIIFSFLNQFETHAEISTNKGRIDVLVETPTHLYIIEFKLDQSAEIALKQIKETGYPEKYAQKGKEIVLVGINFNKAEKTITDWKKEVRSQTEQ